MGTFMSLVIIIMIYERIQSIRHGKKMAKLEKESKHKRQLNTYRRTYDSLDHLFVPSERKGK